MVSPLLLFFTNVSVLLLSTPNDLKLSFDTTNYNYSSYFLQIKNFENQLDVLWRGKVAGRKPYSEVKVRLPRTYERLHIEITPEEYENGGNCSSRCDTFSQTIQLPLETQETSCEKLDDLLALELVPDTRQSTVTAILKTTPCMCLLKMHDPIISFYRITNDSLGLTCSDPESDCLIPMNGSKAVNVTCGIAAQIAAKPGKYCVHVIIQHSGTWNIYYSATEELKESSLEEISLKKAVEIWHLQTVSYYLFGASIIAILFALLIIYMKCRNSGNGFSTLSQNEEFDVQELMDMVKAKARNMEFIILYSHDFYEHQEAVIAFQDFLVRAWSVGCVQMDVKSEAEIGVIGSLWTESVTEYRTNRHIIIVESKGAVLQERAQKELKVLHPTSGDYLATVFPYAARILRNDYRSYTDYNNISVVKFEYCPEDLRLTSFVPNRRYILPKHLFTLYCTILGFNMANLSFDLCLRLEEKLTKEWQVSLEQILIPNINNAVKALKEDPDLIETNFTVSLA